MRHHRFPSSWQRPPWWPENEDWPPRRRLRPRPFFRFMGCMFMLVSLVVVGLFVFFVAWLVGALTNIPVNQVHWVVPVGFALAIVAFFVLALAGMGFRSLSIPLDDLLEAADRIAEGDYSVRVPESGPHRVRPLARAFNNMAARLHGADEQRRSLLADVTHELRTPLTVVQGNLEGMLDGVYPADEATLRSLLEETRLLSRLVEDLRTLALAESGALQLKKEPTELGILIRDALAVFQSQADAVSVSLFVEGASNLPVMELDPGRIRQVLSNLVANALRYTPAGGAVTLHGGREENSVWLEVHDSGPGIPAEDLPHIFERFHRSTDSGGMGLGLAIAKHLVEAHAGTITAASTPGQGTTIHIELPLDHNSGNSS
jgi:two-component system, OmpR family, sensor histidine kinase BaeS